MLLTVHSLNNSAASSSAASIRGESEEACFLLVMEKEEIMSGKWCLGPEEGREGKNSLRARDSGAAVLSV